MPAMNIKDFVLPVVCCGALLTAGCVSTVDGRHRYGIPVSKDKIENRYERPAMEVWNVAKEVLNYNGRVYSEDILKSTLQASVNDRTVWVKVEEVEKKYTRVVVQARTKGGWTDVELASEIQTQIGVRLASGVPLPPRAESKQSP